MFVKIGCYCSKTSYATYSALWVLVSRTLNENDGLSNSTSTVGWHVDLCTCACTLIFYHVLWNLNQLWLGYSFGSGVVGLEIKVWYCFWKCEWLLFVPLLNSISATSQTLSLARRHPNRLPVTLVAQRLWSSRTQEGRSPGRSLWVKNKQKKNTFRQL